MDENISNMQPADASEHPQGKDGMSRRAFLRNTGLAVGGIGAMAALGGCAPQQQSEATTDDANQGTDRTTDELPIPEVAAPDKVTYECDVCVVGGGFAGINAAYAAKESGKSVVLIDKGRPGYSGLSPWASSHRWFDAEFGDDEQAFKDCMTLGTEYIGNADWYQVWIDESKAAYERLMDWEILTQFPRASEAGEYFNELDFVGYREDYSEYDRRTKFVKMLEENDIDFADYTMITDIIEDGGKVVGALGFHVPSGTIVTVNAKSIVMCTGGGSYKPTGYPVGDDTFDGEYLGYHLGLPIAGKEFDDFHMTQSWAPGNALVNNSWPYLENIWLCGGDVTADGVTEYVTGKAKAMVLDRLTKATQGLANNDGTDMEDQENATVMRRGGTASEDPDDPRQGKRVDPLPKGDIYGAAVGMCGHLSSGVFCGLDDLTGYSGYPGLYYAGDGANASAVTGAMYSCGVGFTSSFCSIQGYRAGEAAAVYADTVDLTPLPSDQVESVKESITGPRSIETGFDPNWARDELQAIMSPYWINAVKTEETLVGALTQIEYMRDNVVPKLKAETSHDLRLCHEMKHKVLSAEMKLRSGIERRESRGFHYRSDYPYRDDDNFLCYIAVRKGDDGSMEVSRIPVKPEWTGDVTQDYASRYLYRFPGETKAKGLPAEESSGGWGSKS